MVLILAIIFMLVTFKYIYSKYNKNKFNKSGKYVSIDDKFNSDKIETKKRVDGLLDKISKRGYESLTDSERDYLKLYSEKL